MPPMLDVGLYPRQIQFTFTASTTSGLEVTNQKFLITVLPVDNQVSSLVNQLQKNKLKSVIFLRQLFIISFEFKNFLFGSVLLLIFFL